MYPYGALSWLSAVGISGELHVGIDCLRKKNPSLSTDSSDNQKQLC